MKNAFNKFTLVAASIALLSSAAQAAIVFTDTFDSGTGSWYKADTQDTTTLSNASGKLSFVVGSAQEMSEVIGRNFTTQTLAVGETIRVTFDYSQTASAGIFRIGLFDLTGRIATADDWSGAATPAGTWAGYYTFIRDNSGSGNVARSDTGSFNGNKNVGPTFGGTTITSPANSTNFNINDNGTVTYQGLFEVTRTSLSEVNTLYTLTEGATTRFSVSGVDSAALYTSFDTVTFKGDTGTMLFDNVQVAVIPEPSAALLCGLGMLAVLRRRR